MDLRIDNFGTSRKQLFIGIVKTRFDEGPLNLNKGQSEAK